MGLARIVLFGSALAYGAVAVGFLAAPASLASFVGVSLGGATADNDIRAVYGVVALGLALFFVVSSRRPEWYVQGVLVAALTLGSMAFARFVSILVAGPPEWIAYLLHGSEVVGFLLALIAMRRLGGVGSRAAA